MKGYGVRWDKVEIFVFFLGVRKRCRFLDAYFLVWMAGGINRFLHMFSWMNASTKFKFGRIPC